MDTQLVYVFIKRVLRIRAKLRNLGWFSYLAKPAEAPQPLDQVRNGHHVPPAGRGGGGDGVRGAGVTRNDHRVSPGGEEGWGSEREWGRMVGTWKRWSGAWGKTVEERMGRGRLGGGRNDGWEGRRNDSRGAGERQEAEAVSGESSENHHQTLLSMQDASPSGHPQGSGSVRGGTAASTVSSDEPISSIKP